MDERDHDIHVNGFSMLKGETTMVIDAYSCFALPTSSAIPLPLNSPNFSLRPRFAIALTATLLLGAINCHGQVFERLFSFSEAEGATINRGNTPLSGLVRSDSGDFYGTTTYGGIAGFGTIFKVTPSGKVTTLVEFTGDSGEKKGSLPVAGLLLAKDGNFYGTTTQGGDSDLGTLYKLTPGGEFTTLLNFSPGGPSEPTGELTQDSAGNFYGFTLNGPSGFGAIFKMTPDRVLSTLVEFTGTTGSKLGSNGQVATSQARLVEDGNGNLFGTTPEGGAGNHGTVFKVTKTGVLTTLVQFTGDTGINPGRSPRSELLRFEGNFYGTTELGGAFGLGTIFKMAPTGEMAFRVDLEGSTGARPKARLVESGGVIYGTTFRGGSGDLGTVFRMTTSGALITIAEFTNDGDTNKGGVNPYSGLTLGADGNFYGTTGAGGAFGIVEFFGAKGFGTIYKVTPTGEMTKLTDFSGGGTSGGSPVSGLIQDVGGDGQFYGVTGAGGAGLFGTVYKMTAGGDLTTIAPIDGNFPEFPVASLLKHEDGSFYGTALNSIYKLAPTGEATRLIDVDGLLFSSLIDGGNGYLYGTNRTKGSDGSVFRLMTDGSPAGTSLETLVEFSNNGATNKGRDPSASLLDGGDGYFYGTTFGGGASNLGTIFRMSPSGNLITLVEFTGTHEAPTAQIFNNTAPIAINDNSTANPYPSQINVPGGNQIVSKIRVALKGFSHSFPADTRFLLRGPSGATCLLISRVGGGAPGVSNLTLTIDDDAPTTVATLSSSGIFRPSPNGEEGISLPAPAPAASYGSQLSAFNGKPMSGIWSLYVVDTAGSDAGALQGGWSLEITPADTRGAGPTSALVKGDDGNYYGTTSTGGAAGNGTVFKVSAISGELTTLVDFTGNSGLKRGAEPLAGLLKDTDGSFYGTTSRGGASNSGTVFQMSPSGDLTTLFEFPDEQDSAPNLGPLIRGSDGNLYGTTLGKAILGRSGSIYRIIFPGAPVVTNAPPSPTGATTALLQGRVNARGSETLATLEYWTGGIDPPNPLPSVLPVATGIDGYRTRLVGTTLAGLAQGTTYYYRFRAISSAGETVSPVQSFSTLAVPLVVSLPATDISPTSALLIGTVNARNFGSTVTIEWGTDGNSFPNKVVATPETVTGNTDIPISYALAGLNPGANYFYRIVATNSGGTVTSGAQSFRTLIPATPTITGATALSTTRAQVTGFVDAEGSSASVSFEYGTDGINFPNSFSATPFSVSGDLPVEVTATLTGLTQGTTYHFRIRAQGPGGTGLSDTSKFSLSILSGLVQLFPDSPPTSNGTLTVNFSPPETGAWRFTGDTKWLNSGVPSGNLAFGQRVIEFLPIPGFISPSSETVDVTGSANLTLDRLYYETPTAGTGSLTVRLKPDEISAPGVPESDRAQWRIVGETTWRNGGATLVNLVAGSYLVECKPVAGRETPPPIPVTLAAGDEREITLTYFTANTSAGSPPLPQSFADVSANEDMPFAHVGQIRTDVGSSTGFVVKRRVVATAGHVVFDDGTLSVVTGMRWFFQRHNGSYEPRPQIPRGTYLAAGYAERREADNSPGEGSALSQRRDFAAVYFSEEAGRGGYGGFLASDSGDDNEFLTSTADKILAGYPTSSIPSADIGRLHATTVFTSTLTPIAEPLGETVPFLGSGKTWTTTAARGLGGMSGGPLFVRHTSGAYFPAAIYLGGDNQTVVRAIDDEVVDLFLRAEVSGNGGDNNTNGGVTHTSVVALASGTVSGSIQVNIEPAAARTSGGGWRLKSSDTSFRQSGFQRSALNSGSYILELTTVSGFQPPAQQIVTVTGGQLTQISYTYAPTVSQSPLETWRQTHFGTTENTGDAADDNDFDKDGMKNIDEFTAGTDPKSSNDVFKIATTAKAGNTFTATCSGKAGRTYTLLRNTGLSGTWTRLVSQGTLADDAGVSLSDTSAPPDKSFYRIEVSMP